MSASERKLITALALSEEKLSIRTRERDQVEIALVTSEHELEEIHSEFSTFTAKSALTTAKLSRRTTQLNESNQELLRRTKELYASNEALNLLTHEKECFVSVLQDLTNPIVGNTRILEYIAAGKASPEKQPDLLKRLIGHNDNLLIETNRFTNAFLELSQANADLKEMKSVMKQREDFVATLTHDLRSPLLGCSQVLGFLADGTIKAENISDTLRMVIESHKNMLHLIGTMMEVYKSDSGCLVPFLSSVDVVALSRRCIGEFTYATKAKNIDLRVDVLEVPPAVNTDSSLLRRVLINLLDNAVKFTPEGGQVTLSVSQSPQQVRLSVKNSGSGLSEVDCEHVFDRFWQKTPGRQYSIGTGLGLFLAKQIMESLGGCIECSSTELAGTEFVVTLKTG